MTKLTLLIRPQFSLRLNFYEMLKLFMGKSYFSCRRQFVQINQTCSSMQTIKYGVPQGSILGSLFFVLYINDLPKDFKLTERLLFADDTSIFFSHSNPNYLENVLNNELLNIYVWFRCNKLSINV